MNKDDIISRNKGWLSAWVGSQLVMMSADSSMYLNLTGTGGRIWELLETPRSVGELCRCLVAEFAAPEEQIEAEAREFLTKLEEQHAIEVRPPALA